ncbi:hypothetical protein BH23CYA1_BH23CYA1_05560 [soil metagenome]
MKRRDFMNWIGVGAIAASLPVAIAACSPDSETADETAAAPPDAPDAAGGDTAAGDFMAIGTTAELEQQGYLATPDSAENPIVVIADPANPEALIALSAKCTHAGCTVAWQEDLFACPCHGSKFGPDGSVVDGPADEPLAQYTAKVEGDSILVSTT